MSIMKAEMNCSWSSIRLYVGKHIFVWARASMARSWRRTGYFGPPWGCNRFLVQSSLLDRPGSSSCRAFVLSALSPSHVVRRVDVAMSSRCWGQDGEFQILRWLARKRLCGTRYWLRVGLWHRNYRVDEACHHPRIVFDSGGAECVDLIRLLHGFVLPRFR